MRFLLCIFRQQPIGVIALVALAILCLAAIFPAYLSPHDPLTNNYRNLREAPSKQFWMGTDYLGRDVFSRVIWGTRISIIVGFGSVLIGTTIGGIWGLASGYTNRFDVVSQRILEVIMAFPSLILAMVLVLALRPGLVAVLIAIAVTRMPYGVRVMRSVALAAREYAYVDAARAFGASNFRIVVRHILPNCIAPYIVLATAHLGAAIVIEASLGFLGVGVPAPTPTWGNMLGGTVAQQLEPLWWVVFFPGAAIVITVLAFNLLGDALRDVLDPKLRGSR